MEKKFDIKSAIFAFSILLPILHLLDGDGLVGAEYFSLILIVPAAIILFTDFAEDVFKKYIEIVFVFGALLPIAFDPVVSLLKNSKHEYFLYTTLALSLVVFLCLYVTEYIEWLSIISYFAFLVFCIALVYTSILFITSDSLCERGETKENSFCTWVDNTITSEVSASSS